MTAPPLARRLFGETLLRRDEGVCVLTEAGRGAVASARLRRGEVVALADVASALDVHPRTILAAVAAGDVTPADLGVRRLFFELGEATAFVGTLRAGVGP